MSISISPGGPEGGGDGDDAGDGESGSALTSCTGGKPLGRFAMSWRRQVNSNPVLISCRSATRLATAFGANASCTMRSLSAGVQRRRRSRRTRTSTCSGRSLSRGRLRTSYDASFISAAVQ